MNEFVPFVVMGILATVAVLIAGLVSMSRGGSLEAAHATRLMYARVAMQALTLALLLLAAFSLAF